MNIIYIWDAIQILRVIKIGLILKLEIQKNKIIGLN